jgi:hypothetical protein
MGVLLGEKKKSKKWQKRTHEGRGRAQVATDRGKVERGDGEDESFQGPVLETVPDAGSVLWRLRGVNLRSIGAVEAPEVAQLGGSVNLCLPNVLSLANHGGGKSLETFFVKRRQKKNLKKFKKFPR